jgi:hypothetical protein
MFMSGMCRFNDERRIRRILDLEVERGPYTPAFSKWMHKATDEAAAAGRAETLLQKRLDNLLT